jgi:hypothetical protein
VNVTGLFTQFTNEPLTLFPGETPSSPAAAKLSGARLQGYDRFAKGALLPDGPVELARCYDAVVAELVDAQR